MLILPHPKKLATLCQEHNNFACKESLWSKQVQCAAAVEIAVDASTTAQLELLCIRASRNDANL